MRANIDSKMCRRCRETLPIERFPVTKSGRLSNLCETCHVESEKHQQARARERAAISAAGRQQEVQKQTRVCTACGEVKSTVMFERGSKHCRACRRARRERGIE